MFRKTLLFICLTLFICSGAHAAKPDWADDRCPGSGDPPPINRPADLPQLVRSLKNLKNQKGKSVWVDTLESRKDLKRIFQNIPMKTKIEQFYQLMFHIYKHLPKSALPFEVSGAGIKDTLMAAKVFRTADFPKMIQKVRVSWDGPKKYPVFEVSFAQPEVRFSLNDGKGFSMWKNGKCQLAKELVFYDDFSFRLKERNRSKNLVVYDFERAQLFGDFGNRGILTIDLSYVDLEKVEFINGTDEGKVTVRVARREFYTNEHSKLFKYVGRLIPNTSRQRIDW